MDVKASIQDPGHTAQNTSLYSNAHAVVQKNTTRFGACNAARKNAVVEAFLCNRFSAKHTFIKVTFLSRKQNLPTEFLMSVKFNPT